MNIVGFEDFRATLRTLTILLLIFCACMHIIRLGAHSLSPGGRPSLFEWRASTQSKIWSDMDGFRSAIGEKVLGTQRVCPSPLQPTCSLALEILTTVVGIHP